MARELNRSKLLIVLKKKSPPLVEQSNGYMECFRRATKQFEMRRREFDQKIVAGAKEAMVNGDVLAVGFASELSEEMVSCKDVANEELAEQLSNAIESKKEETANNSSLVCSWGSDTHLHTAYINNIRATGENLLENMFSLPYMEEAGMREQMEIFLQAVEFGTTLELAVTHAYLICEALELPTPAQVQALISNSTIFETLKEDYTPQKRAGEIKLLSQVPQEDLVRELLKILQPKRWEKYLEGCIAPIVVVPPPVKAAPVFPKEHTLLAGRLLQEYPDESFSGEFVDDLGRACSWDEGRALAVVELEYYGINREDALFILEQGEAEEMVPKHTLMASVLELQGICHQEMYYGFRLLNEDQCWDLGEKLDEYFAWLELMPGNWGELEIQQASAVLSLITSPPENRDEVLELLELMENDILEVLLEADGNVGLAERIIEDYKSYCRRFEKTSQETAPKKREVRTPLGNIRVARPHELITFSHELEGEINAAGISPENVKRMLAYGLRLSSRKASIGGKYFPIEMFRNNSRRVLTKEAGNPDERVKVVEEFLTGEGVISTYKQGRFARLNVKKDGEYVEPTELGQRILDAVIGWKVEFDREPGNK